VTLVHPLVSEVTLIIDRDLAIPVLNVRTGVRSLAFGDAGGGGGLELRFMGSNTDVLQGDLLTTSGVDGVYPPGLPVARIDRIERRAETAFARIHCIPLALVSGVRHVVVLTPQSAQIAARPPEAAPVAPVKKGGRS
jgi:rod shape-determining protein MreC